MAVFVDKHRVELFNEEALALTTKIGLGWNFLPRAKL
jgi:hypothetical protein